MPRTAWRTIRACLRHAQGMNIEERKKIAAWIRTQLEDVWRALGDGELPGEAERELRVRRAGEDTFYYFIYRGKPCAQARIYFDHLDGQWRFELTQVARAHYESVRAYFTGKMRKGH